MVNSVLRIKVAYFQLRNQRGRKIRGFLSQPDSEKLVFMGLPNKSIHGLQFIQNIHLLPVFRLQFKILKLDRALASLAQQHILDRLSVYNPCRSLQSQEGNLLHVPEASLVKWHSVFMYLRNGAAWLPPFQSNIFLNEYTIFIQYI